MTKESFIEARKSFGRTQAQWAECLGLTRSAIARIEAGGTITPTVEILISTYLERGMPARFRADR